MRIAIAAALALGLAVPVAFAQDPKPPVATKAAPGSPDALDEEFHRAFYLEQGLRDFAKAAEAYAKVAEGAAAPERKDLRAKALLGRARCLRTMGKADEAKALFGKVLEFDPGNEEARQGLAAGEVGGPEDMEFALQQQISSLVGNVQAPGSRENLRRIGARAVPFLEKALREIDVGVVAESAKLLASMNAPGARAALARALNDPEVKFPDLVDEGLDALLPLQQEKDGEGRLRVLEEILKGDSRKRTGRLWAIVKKGFPSGTEPAAAALLAAHLNRAEDAERRDVLYMEWNAEVRRGLIPAVRPLLGSPDADVRRGALRTYAYAPECSAEDVKALSALLDSSAAQERFEAWSALDSRSLLPEPRRGEVFCGFLSGADRALRVAALQYIDPQDGSQQFRWSDSFAPGIVEGMRRALGAPTDGFVLQKFAGLLARVGRSFETGALADIAVLGLSVPSDSQKFAVGAAAGAALIAKVGSVAASEDLTALFLRGFRSVSRDGRSAWVNCWNPLRSRLGAEALQEAAGAPECWQTGANWVAELGQARPPATPAMLDLIVQRLVAVDGNQASLARRLANLYASPAFAPGIRALLARVTDPYQDSAKELRALLVRCVGREAAADLRAILESLWERRTPNVIQNYLPFLRELVDCAGADAVPDLREWLKRTRMADVRDMLVKAVGVDAVPDLVALADDPEGALVAVVDRKGSTWKVGVPKEVLEAFLLKLPAERRTGSLLRFALGSAQPSTRSRIIGESLRSPEPEVVAAAAVAVRQFQLEDWAPHLVPLLDHEDEAVRREAAASLEAIQRYRRLKAEFRNTSEDPGVKAQEDALALAKSPEPAKRRAAALALGALGNRSAIATLLKLVEDSDAAVRDAALAALERLGGRKPVEPPKEE